VPRGRALLRSGAKPGDLLYITGTLGGAAAGLARLGELAESRPGSSNPPRIPKKAGGRACPAPLPPAAHPPGPLVATRRPGLGRARRERRPLQLTWAHLCQEVRVAAEVDAALLPVHRPLTLDQALHGGENYELVFTAPAMGPATRPSPASKSRESAASLKARRGEPALKLLTPQGPRPL